MRIRRKLGGLILLSTGFGIVIGMLIPGIGLLFAGTLIAMGFIYVFM